MTDYRMRIGFAKQGPAVWLSHLEVVRAMERCVRRSGLPYAISQGFNPHMKHTFTTALPVGTGSTGEFMDVELDGLVDPKQALAALQAVQHEHLPVLSTGYAAKDEPSLQVFYNLATYRVELEDPERALVAELVKRLKTTPEIQVIKKRKPKLYNVSKYVVRAEAVEEAAVDAIATEAGIVTNAAEDTLAAASVESISGRRSVLLLGLLSRPEGSLRPETVLKALAEPDLSIEIASLTRIVLAAEELQDT